MTAEKVEQLIEAGYRIRSNTYITVNGFINFSHSLKKKEGETEVLVDVIYGAYEVAVDTFHASLFSKKKKKKKKKKPVDPTHARRRCKQRYKLKLSKRQYQAICQQISEERDAIWLNISNTGEARSIWAVRCAGVWFPVVYDSEHKAVITVLPRNELNGKELPA